MSKRLKRSAVLTAGIAGLFLAVAAAYFVGNFIAEGEHEGQTGSGGNGTKTLPINVSFEDGLTPTKSVPVTATVSNSTAKTIKFTGLSATVTTGAEGCLASWFKVSASTPYFQGALSGQEKEFVFKPGSSPLGKPFEVANEAKFTLEMVETSVDQSACEGVPVKVAMKLTGGVAV